MKKTETTKPAAKQATTVQKFSFSAQSPKIGAVKAIGRAGGTVTRRGR